jgi:hypothetical protein
MGSGDGGVEELLDNLANDEVQYCLVRIPIVRGELQQYRDVFIYWTGPNVSVLQRGKKKTHLGAVTQILTVSISILLCLFDLSNFCRKFLTLSIF